MPSLTRTFAVSVFVAVAAFAVATWTEVFALGMAAMVVAVLLTIPLRRHGQRLVPADWSPWIGGALNLAIVVIILAGPIFHESGDAGWRAGLAALLFSIYATVVRADRS